ncbi:MAG: amidophosphoribosyltransferase, partial [Ruminococcus sp.]|nr:amidophosphoribosyltransferase [Ruminococcus sp.]
YIGRTFIKPSQKERMKSVRIKLNPIADRVRGKRVVMIDDSIVRGTTVDRIVTMLREAGAKEVHMRISSPPFMWPCYYGTDIPSRGELIAVNHSIEEITKLSGADSLAYLPVDSLHEMIGCAPIGFCEGCFTGKYPAPTTQLTLEGKERGGMYDACQGTDEA